jgi:ribonucleotide monophosphatase NagD (HAD superfamily)
MAAIRGTLKAILIDLSGTLHVENTAIPGAVDALKRYVKGASAVG